MTKPFRTSFSEEIFKFCCFVEFFHHRISVFWTYKAWKFCVTLILKLYSVKKNHDVWKFTSIRTCIFHECGRNYKPFCKNGFSVFEGAPLKTLKLVWQLFFWNYFSTLEKNNLSLICKFCSHKCSDIVKPCDHFLLWSVQKSKLHLIFTRWKSRKQISGTEKKTSKLNFLIDFVIQ